MAREKPIPRSRRKLLNRGLLRSRNDDNVKNFSIGLMDIDSTIMYYFNNVIKPTVEENGESVKVPLMYSNPERWSSVQKNGYIVDNKKQLIIPLIVFKRTSIEKDANLAVDKLNAKDPKLFYTFQKQYSEKNRYDKFSVQQGLNKTKELPIHVFRLAGIYGAGRNVLKQVMDGRLDLFNVHSPPIINVGSGEEVTISKLLQIICRIVGYTGDIAWDSEKPDGTPRKLLDSGLLFSCGWSPETSLVDGIELSYQDYLNRN